MKKKMHIDAVADKFKGIVVTNEESYNHLCDHYMSAIKEDVLDAFKYRRCMRDAAGVERWGRYFIYNEDAYPMDRDDLPSSVLASVQDVMDAYGHKDLCAIPTVLLKAVLDDKLDSERQEDFTYSIIFRFKSDAIQPVLLSEVKDEMAALGKKISKIAEDMTPDAARELATLLQDGVAAITADIKSNVPYYDNEVVTHHSKMKP